VLAIIVFFSIYNSLVRLRNQVRNSWSQIDVQLKRRHDLIPNLIETAKGYNDSVMNMNNKVQMFPSNIVAGMSGFRQEAFFEIEVKAEREVPKVSFS
jgi:LemA protein